MNKKIKFATQLILGSLVMAAGINKLYLFMPVPEQTPAGKDFIDFLYHTGYLMHVVAIVEIITGGLLILSKLVPLAILALTPVTVNILLFHIFLEQKGLPIGLFLFSLHAILILLHRHKFRILLDVKNESQEEAEQLKGSFYGN